MDDQTTQKKLKENKSQLIFDIAEVYSFVKSTEFTRTFSNLTLDNFLQEAIDNIEKKINRPSKKDRLKNIENLINSITDKLS